jgi:light-independent protochlorophyllide reductase subunit B
MGIDVEVVAPLNACVQDLQNLAQADFNVVLYPEIANTSAAWLQRQFDQPYTKTVPIGVGATRLFMEEVAALAGVKVPDGLAGNAQSVWYARSVDSTYLTGKRVFLFGDATHVVAAAKFAAQEMGFEVAGIGTYSREFAREVRDAAKLYNVEPLITDDYLLVEEAIKSLHPELILGTQMERHIAKRLGIPCAVISAPVHVQDFPARYAPQMGFEGANVLFDTWVHPLMMGLEEHLLGMFREDFEFHSSAAPSHLGSAGVISVKVEPVAEPEVAQILVQKSPNFVNTESTSWSFDAEKELGKIPFFVRGKARRNTERYALDHGVMTITVETLYDAKAYFSR